MSQVRKYQTGGTTPENKEEVVVEAPQTPVVPGLEEIVLKPKLTESAEQPEVKPKSYFIWDGEKIENNDVNRQKFLNFLAKVSSPNGGSQILSQIGRMAQEAAEKGYSLKYDTPSNKLYYLDTNGNGMYVDWENLNENQDRRIQKNRSWLGRFFDANTNNNVQQAAKDISRLRNFRRYLNGDTADSTTIDPDLINIGYGNGFFQYLKDPKTGLYLKDEDGRLKYDKNSATNQTAMQILNRMNRYLGLTTDDERNQFKLADGWTEDKLNAIKGIYSSDPAVWKSNYDNILNKIVTGQELGSEDISWLKLFGFDPNSTEKTPEEIAAEKANLAKTNWTNAGYGDIYDKGNPWFDLDENNNLILNETGKAALEDYLLDSPGNEFNDEWIKYLTSKHTNVSDLDWLKGYTLYNGRLYKTDSGKDPNSALGKIYATSGFINKNKANQYGEAQKIINTFWGNPYEWSTADESMYSGFTWDPTANNGAGGYRMNRYFRNETGRYSGIESNQQLVSYYDPDAKRDYRGIWTDSGQRFAITNEWGDIIADGLTAADLEQRGIKKIIDSAGNEIPYDPNRKFHQRTLYKSNDVRINNHTGLFFGKENEYALYYNPMRVPNSQDPYSHVLYSDPELDAAYVVPATLGKFLYEKNANGIPGIQALIADVNLQKRFRNILKNIADGRLLGGGYGAIKNVCKQLGMTEVQAEQVDQEAQRMIAARKSNGRLDYKVAKEAINQAKGGNDDQVSYQKQGGIIRKFAPGGGFAKTSGSTASTSQTKVNIRDSRQAAKIGKNVKDGEDKFTDADWADLGGLILDIGAIAAGSMPIAGGVAGLGGTAAGLYADISRDGFQWTDLASAGLSGAMDVVSMLPGIGSGVQAAKVASKIAKKYKWVIRGLSLLGAGSAIPLVDKLVKEGNLSVQEWRALANGIAAGTNIAKLGGLGKSTKPGAFKNIDINSKTAVDSITIKPKTGEDLPEIKLTKDQLRELDSITDQVKKQDKFRAFVKTSLAADPRTKGQNVNSLLNRYDLTGSTTPVPTNASGEIKLNTRNAGEGPEITLSKAEIDEINAQPTASAKMAKARETVAHKLWEKRGKPIGTPEIDEKNALKYNYRDLWSPRVKSGLSGRPDITLDKTDIETISSKAIPAEQQKAFIDIVKSKSGDDSLDSIDRIKDAFKVDDFFEMKRGSWEWRHPFSSIKNLKKNETFTLKAERTEEPKPTRGNKGVINPVRDWWNNVGTYRGINRSDVFNTKPATTSTTSPTPASPTSGTSGGTRAGTNWWDGLKKVTNAPGIRVMQLGNNPSLRIHNYPIEEAPGVVEDENNLGMMGVFTYKKGGLIPKAEDGLKDVGSGGQTAEKLNWGEALAKAAPTIGEFGSMITAIKANNAVNRTLNNALKNPPMIIAPQYNIPIFNDNGILNEGRQLIKDVYNRQPANYTSDAMLNNFVRKANQEKATEYQNKVNNLFSQQLAQHNAKMDEIFYKNRENQINVANQNHQTIFANTNAIAKNNAATTISNWQSVDNFAKSRIRELSQQLTNAQAIKKQYAEAKRQNWLNNQSGYTNAINAYRTYAAANPTGLNFNTWLLTIGAAYKPDYDLVIRESNIMFIDDQLNAENLGIYKSGVKNYLNSIWDVQTKKSGGKLSNYKAYRDYREQIAIDSNKEIRKAIAQLNKDCQQLLLKMLK